MAKTPKTTVASPKQMFTVLRPIRHDGDTYAEGDIIELVKDEFEQLAAASAVEGEWQDAAKDSPAA